MKTSFLISVVVCVILTSCSEQQDVPAAFPSIMPESSSTSISTPTQTQPLKLSPTPTVTPLPLYQTKQVAFDYNIIGDHSVYTFFFEPNTFRPSSMLILYTDGQMIIPGETYRQKILSPDEIDQFLSKLEAMGFYSLESNQKHDPTDQLYNYGNNYQKSYDGHEYCVLMNADKSRNLCVYEPDIQFLIPKMKNILEYLDGYEPAGMTPYYPDRILLWIQLGRNTNDKNLPETASLWPDSLPSLEASSGRMVYLDGEMAKKVYAVFGNKASGNVFIQNGIEYTVYIDIVLPHEKVTNAYQ